MSDDMMIKAVAQLWVDNGGDSEGILWSVNQLASAVQEEIDARNSADNEKDD